MNRFDYFAPASIEEALELLRKYGRKAQLMAGGTDLLVGMKTQEINPEYVIDLKHIANLEKISYGREDFCRVGALTRVGQIEISPIIKGSFGILSQAASVLGSVQIRNKGTIGGNLCNASPAADLAPPLLALDAKVKLATMGGMRLEKLENFFTGPGTTILKPEEILTEIQIPSVAPSSSGIYLKFSRRKAMDLALVGVALVVTLDPSRRICADARLALGAVAPTPIRLRKVEEIVRGRQIDQDLIDEVSNLAVEEARPISDIRSSAWYRKQIIRSLVRKAVTLAVENHDVWNGGAESDGQSN
jgi:carbon-monoxide dehydrogenase medium subunit